MWWDQNRSTIVPGGCSRDFITTFKLLLQHFFKINIRLHIGMIEKKINDLITAAMSMAMDSLNP